MLHRLQNEPRQLAITCRLKDRVASVACAKIDDTVMIAKNKAVVE